MLAQLITLNVAESWDDSFAHIDSTKFTHSIALRSALAGE